MITKRHGEEVYRGQDGIDWRIHWKGVIQWNGWNSGSSNTAPLTAVAGMAPVVTAIWTPIALVVGGAIRSRAIAPGAAVMTGGMEATLSGVAATRVAEVRIPLSPSSIPLSPSSENKISEAVLVSKR